VVVCVFDDDTGSGCDALHIEVGAPTAVQLDAFGVDNPATVLVPQRIVVSLMLLSLSVLLVAYTIISCGRHRSSRTQS
jgi:hypothetical protein